MRSLRVTSIDNQPAIILTPELAARLRAEPGGEVQAIESAAGALLQPLDAETATQLDIATNVMERRRDALRRLAE